MRDGKIDVKGRLQMAEFSLWFPEKSTGSFDDLKLSKNQENC
jgi:hypothetical protein